MPRLRRLALGALAFVVAILEAPLASAQPETHRILDSIDLVRRGETGEMRVRFNTRVRYLRHAPRSRGATVEIRVDPLALSFRDLPLLTSHEAMTPERGAPVPLVDVTYEGNVTGDKLLVLHFSREVEFEVRQGEDFRSLVIAVEDERALPLPAPPQPPAPAVQPTPPAPEPPPRPALEPPPRAPREAAPSPAPTPPPLRAGRFAVQIAAAPPGAPLPDLPSGPALEGALLYTTEVRRDGAPLRRVRVGLFDDRAAADRARGALARVYPEAFVVEAGPDDLAASGSPVLARPAPRSTPQNAGVRWSPPPGPASDAILRQSAELMAAGRSALTAGDVDEAIRVFTKVLTLPEHDATAEAKDLLGVARERRGQLAHAKAEYEEYLSRWPEGDAAARVRQRRDALVTASARPPAPQGGDGGRAAAGRRFDVHGSAATQYHYEAIRTDPTGTQAIDSSVYTDLTLLGRTQTEGWKIRTQAAGSYRYDFLDGLDGSEARFSSLYADFAQRSGPYGATVGRQPGNSAGVNSRFDGVRVSRRLGERWKVTALGGSPVELRHSDRIETGRYLYGLSLDATRLFGRLDGQLFAIQQRADGLLDRTAVGGELRYADEKRFAAAYVDYDVLFQSLNTVLLTGSWQVTSSTNLNAMFDYRNTPVLTSWNAIQGQPVSRVGRLRDTFSDAEIRQLARDRTPRSTMASLGGTQQISERVQLAMDVSASRLDGTPASGGIEAMEGTGWELSYYPQLIATGLLTDTDVGTLGFRYFDGTTSDSYSLILHERYPITRALRVLPRLRVDWRNRRGRDEFAPRPEDFDANPIAASRAARVRNGSWTVRPFLGLEYRIGRITLDTDAGFEWTSEAFSPDATDEIGWSLSSGVRYDF